MFAGAVDFLHLFAAVVWIGGMFFIAAVFSPAQMVIEPPSRGKMFGAIAKRFTVVAWASVVILAITGLIKTPSELLFSFGSTYGIFLSIKQGLFVLMAVLGALIAFVFAPKMRANSPKPGEQPTPEFIAAQKRLALLSKINLASGVAILACLAVMHTV